MKKLFLVLCLLIWFVPTLAEACQQYRDVVQDRNGHVIVGVSITVVIAGTSTIPTLYSDPTCVTPTVNPMLSDSAGQFIFFAPDGEYGINFVKTGYSFTNVSRVAIYDPLGENIVTVAKYTTTDICAAGLGAIDQIGATAITLVVNKPVTCSITKAIPPTLTIQRMGSGLITVAAGQTLTVSSPSAVIADGATQVFAGTGAVAFTIGGTIDAGWFCPPSGDQQACLTAALASIQTGTLHLVPRTWSYATSPNFAKAGVNIKAEQGAVLSHTGTGTAFKLDAGPQPSAGIGGLTYDGIVVQGNANSTSGIFVRSIFRSRFIATRVLGAATTGDGILVAFGVLNEWISPHVSVNDALSPVPKYGMRISRDTTGDNSNSTTQLVYNAIMEGLTQAGGAGIQVDFANTNTFIGGTSEGNTTGISVTADSGTGQNTFKGLFLESNTTDIALSAPFNTFENITSVGTTTITAATANRNTFLGGFYTILTLDSNTALNTFYNVSVLTTLTDNSAVGVENEWINCTTPGGFTRTNKLRGGIASPINFPGYTASITHDAFVGNTLSVTVTNNSAFQFENPTNPTRGQPLSIMVVNTSGGPIATPTFGTKFKMASAFTSPATGKSRSIWFRYDGTNWIEEGRGAADVSN